MWEGVIPPPLPRPHPRPRPRAPALSPSSEGEGAFLRWGIGPACARVFVPALSSFEEERAVLRYVFCCPLFFVRGGGYFALRLRRCSCWALGGTEGPAGVNSVLWVCPLLLLKGRGLFYVRSFWLPALSSSHEEEGTILR